MKTKNLKGILSWFKYLLFLPILFLTFCQEGSEDIIDNTELTIVKESKIVSLLKAALTSDGDDEQCAEFSYPIVFYAIFADSQSIQTIVINNDQELFDFFDQLTGGDQLSIDFPITLLGVDGEETIINNITELENILEVVVDACRGNDDYDYCDDNNKKVYICHKGETICISINAIWAHLNNHEEDYLGQCDDDDDSGS